MPESDFPLTEKFQRGRWSKTRQQIHELPPGHAIVLPLDQKNNAKTSASRLREAYKGTRRWRVRITETGVFVERLQPSRMPGVFVSGKSDFSV